MSAADPNAPPPPPEPPAGGPRFSVLGPALTPNVLLLGVVSLGNDLASEMILPLLPAFITLTLGAGPAFVGLIEGVADGVSALLKLHIGRVTDRSGRRKPWVITGYLLSSLVRPLIGLAGVPLHVLGVRLVDRVGKGLRTSPRDALLAASVSAEHRATAFGLHRAMDHAGAVLGGLLGAGLLASGWPVRDVFLLALLPGLLPSLLLLTLREVPPSAPQLQRQAPAPSGPLGTSFSWLIGANALAAVGTVGEGLLLLRAQSLGAGLASLPLLWAALHAVKSVVSALAGPLADRLGRARLLAAGWVAQAALYALLARTERLELFVALFLAWGFRVGLTEGAEKALIAEYSPPERRGTAYGWFHGVNGMAMMAGGALLGGLWQALGTPAALTAATLLSLTALVPLSRAAARGAPD